MRKRWRARRLTGALAAPLALAGMMTVTPPAGAAACTDWNGSQPGGAADVRLTGVAAVSLCDVWAVGYQKPLSGPVIEHWTGGSWATVSPGVDKGILYGVSAVSASDIWAVGASSLTAQEAQILHWDGSSWTKALTSLADGTGLSAVDSLSATDAWAVGWQHSGDSYHPVAVHWDGSSWSPRPVPDPDISSASDSLLTGVSVVSASDAWAVGQSKAGPFAVRWDGSHWNPVSIPGLSGNDILTGVSAVSAGDVWASGYNLATNQALVLHWDGTAWNRVPSPNPGGNRWNTLSAVTATSARDVWAVGDYADPSYNDLPLVLHWDGSSWAVVTVAAPTQGLDNNLRAVSATPTGQAWVAGTHAGTGSFAAPVPAVPDVTGDSAGVASGVLAAYGLAAGGTTVTHNCPAASNGLTVATSPAAGQQAPFGRAVVLTICDGTTIVPNVLSTTDADAQRRITSVGLTVGTISVDNRCLDIAGDVIAQNPGGGAQVLRGTAVNLTESSGMNNKNKPCPVIA
jgi:hypothetical protein